MTATCVNFFCACAQLISCKKAERPALLKRPGENTGYDKLTFIDSEVSRISHVDIACNRPMMIWSHDHCVAHNYSASTYGIHVYHKSTTIVPHPFFNVGHFGSLNSLRVEIKLS